jgi:tRNA pseudouridine55 synthase
MKGFLLIDKPEGMTSHDVVNRIRKLTGERRVGHAGTLDPFATGLLLVAVQREATRELSKFIGLDKRYEAEFLLGARSDTDDRTGNITSMSVQTSAKVDEICLNGLSIPMRRTKTYVEWGGRVPVKAKIATLAEVPVGNEITKEEIGTQLKHFIGKIDQVPPAYSAIKVSGEKMYEAARKGRVITAKPRRVTVHKIILHSITPSLHHSITARLTLHVSSGTYIRAIARDLGERLGVGGYVQELRRASIGPFSLEEANKLDFLTNNNVESQMLAIEDVLSRL